MIPPMMIGLSTAVKIDHSFDQKGPVLKAIDPMITVRRTVTAAYAQIFRYFGSSFFKKSLIIIFLSWLSFFSEH